VLGVPGSPGAFGWLLLVLGAGAGAAVLAAFRERLLRAPPPVAAANACLVVTCALVPFLAHRIEQDLQVTTGLHGYNRAAAGPVQSYLPGYLVDNTRRLIPLDATFSTVVSRSVPWPAARGAFPALAMETLFPRVSVANPARADYVVTWGIRPSKVVPVTRSWLARAQTDAYPAVYVGKVAW
jgi:hypothetical protein